MAMTRREMVLGVVASALAALGLEGCARRAPSAEEPTPATSQPTQPVAAAPRSGQPTPEAAGGAPKRGGMLLVGVQNDWVTMDPAYNNGGADVPFMVYDPLFFQQMDAAGNLQLTPGLAEKWEFTDTAATLHLRKGV